MGRINRRRINNASLTHHAVFYRLIAPEELLEEVPENTPENAPKMAQETVLIVRVLHEDMDAPARLLD